MADRRQSEACRQICVKFGVKELTDDQICALSNVVNGKDLFISTRTGSGKSLCYQALPVFAQVTTGRRVVVAIITPLLYIMKEQVKYLVDLGLKAGYVGSGNMSVEDVKAGKFDYIYGTPESLVGNDAWRNLFLEEDFRKLLGLIVVDEAHTIHQWYVLFFVLTIYCQAVCTVLCYALSGTCYL